MKERKLTDGLIDFYAESSPCVIPNQLLTVDIDF